MALIDLDGQSRGSRFNGDESIDVWNQAQVVNSWNTGNDWYINYMADLSDIQITCQAATTTTIEPTTTTIGIGSPFRIRNRLTNKCVDVAGTTAPTNGSRLQLWDCLGGGVDYGQLFMRMDNGMIKNVLSGLCIDVEGAPGVMNNHAIMLWACDMPKWYGESDHFWNLTETGLLRNNLSGKCMDVEGFFGVGNGHAIRLYTCDDPMTNPNTDHTWSFTNQGTFVDPPAAISADIILQVNQASNITCNDIIGVSAVTLANSTGVNIAWISADADFNTCQNLTTSSSNSQPAASSSRRLQRDQALTVRSPVWINLSLALKVMVPDDSQMQGVSNQLTRVFSVPTEFGVAMQQTLQQGLGTFLGDFVAVLNVSRQFYVIPDRNSTTTTQASMTSRPVTPVPDSSITTSLSAGSSSSGSSSTSPLATGLSGNDVSMSIRTVAYHFVVSVITVIFQIVNPM
jgi:hypothetical protein